MLHFHLALVPENSSASCEQAVVLAQGSNCFPGVLTAPVPPEALREAQSQSELSMTLFASWGRHPSGGCPGTEGGLPTRHDWSSQLRWGPEGHWPASQDRQKHHEISVVQMVQRN
jgi:hypothetical protein